MSGVKAPLSLKVRVSTRSTLTVLKHPHYTFIALLLAFFISGFIVWSLNLELFQVIATNPVLSVGEKLRVFWDVHTGILTAFQTKEAISNILFSILFGINGALVVYTLKHHSLKNIPKKSGGIGITLAIISGGCIACGTSILAPLLLTLGVTSSIASRELSSILIWLGSVAICYSIYALGLVVATQNISKKEKP